MRLDLIASAAGLLLAMQQAAGGIDVLPAADAVSNAVPGALLGTWAGARIQDGTPRLFDLSFRRAPDGSLETTLTQPYNGYSETAFPFRYVPGGRFDGTLLSELFGDEMRLVVDLTEQVLRGTVVTGDQQVATVFLRKVVPRAPPAYRTEAVRFPAGVDTLAGSLLLPAGVAQPAVAVMVTGRGYGTREEMLAWAQLLARHGVGALAFDSRGTGGSTRNVDSVTAAVRLEEVHAAVDWLRRREDVGAIGLMSGSAGGWIVPDVAAARDDVAFVVTLAGPAESLADQQGHVTTEFMRAAQEEYSVDEYAAAFAYQRQTVLLAQADAPWESFEAINAAARAARWAEHALIPASPEDEDLDYFRRRVGFDAPDWRGVEVPVLAVFGEADPVVPPGVNVPLLRAGTAGNADVTIVVVPGADHGLASPAGWVGEGAWPERWYRDWAVRPAVFEAVVGWFVERFAE